MIINRNAKSIITMVRVFVSTCLIWAAFRTAIWLRLYVFHGTDNADMTGQVVSLSVFLYGLAVSLLISALLSGREYMWRRMDRAFSVIFLVNLTGILLIILYLYLSHEMDFSRIALFLFWVLSTLFLGFEYSIENYAVTRYWDRIISPQRIIVVGNGAEAKKYIDAVEKQTPRTGTVIGYLGYPKEDLSGCLGPYETIGEILEKEDPDQMVVALEPHEMSFMQTVLEAADKEGIAVHLIPFFNEYYPKNPVTETMGEVNLVDLRSTPLSDMGNALLKRLFDLLGSLVLIIILSPLMLFTALMVRLSSPGPVFFVQNRVGKYKKPFKMLKFRSMKVNDRQDTEWTTDSDPRRTPFGAFIRKYSIDELPQLFNVLMGDMSLVGPRPEIPFYVRQFKETVPLYLLRQQVRPGMTGWAQVHGLRGDTSIEDRVKYDIWYIENWSIFLDIRILFMTAFGGFINNEH